MLTSAVTKALLGCFDEAEERRIVRSLIRGYEQAISDLNAEWEGDFSALQARADALAVERDFFRGQFDQVVERLQKLQGAV